MNKHMIYALAVFWDGADNRAAFYRFNNYEITKEMYDRTIRCGYEAYIYKLVEVENDEDNRPV